MTQSDVVLGYGDGWVAIVPTGTFCFIHNQSSHILRYRFGISSTSAGVIFNANSYIKVEEPIYIKDSTKFKSTLIVIGD